jgi:chitinase
VNPRLRLVASVGGWTRSYRFSDMAVHETPRRRFIDSTVDFLRRERFDGIDLDWEYPTSIGLPCEAGITCDRATDKANFVLLARELRAALEAAEAADGKRYLFTIAAGADRKYVFDPQGRSAWLVELAASLDWINLMTYDYHGTWESSAGLLAPLHRDPADPDPSNVEATVALYLAQGIAPDKLTLGMPFYGKGWVGCSPGPSGDGLYQGCASPAPEPPESTFTFAHLGEQRLVERLGRRWNARARVPYLYDERTGLFITYEDEASIGEKVRYAKEMRLRGAMFWELNADRHGTLAGVVAAGLR